MHAAAGSKTHGNAHINGIRQTYSSADSCTRMNTVTAASAASSAAMRRQAREVRRRKDVVPLTARSFTER